MNNKNTCKHGVENNPSGITRATFATLDAAKEWREKHGGRIFVSEDGFSPEWFSLDWLPTDILMSVHGSGRII